MGSLSLYHKFHILPRESNVPFDGILGNDFFEQHKANIDYKKKILQVNQISNPIYYIQEICKSSIRLKPRSETLINITILNPSIIDGIIPEHIIQNGVYLCKAITRVRTDSVAYASVLNVNEHEVVLNPISLFLEELPSTSFIFNVSMTTEDTRKSLILENIRSSHLNSEEKRSLMSVLADFYQIVHLDSDNLTTTQVIRHKIDTQNASPIAAKTYRYPEIHKSEVNRQMTKMISQGIIRPSVSPWSAPLWIVPKKTDESGQKKYRCVIDYRKLNDVTIGDAYPIPNINEILDQLSHSCYFTTLDLASGFHQIEMDPKDAQKTAFSTPLGHYEFTRMPFGLKNAPAVFQRMMNTVLTGLQGLQCFVYLDDIVIYANSIQDHEIKLRNIFERLDKNNLKLQLDKCEFMRKEVAYLGHVITENGVKPNPDKIQVIKNFPTPKNQKDIKSFLGLVGYYRRFIKDFSTITKPLTKLLKKETQFNWQPNQQEAFNTLRIKLISEPILKYPDFSKEFLLTTDASNFAIGAILSQGDIGSDLPIAYSSRTLNKAESNYSTTERELLAIVWATNHFRPYLYGRRFKIITDHRPLVWLFNVKDPGSKLVRWRLKLEEYDYEIIFKPGRANTNADCLSRLPCNEVQINFNIIKETFDDYVKFYYNSMSPIIFNFNEYPENILKSKDTIAYTTSIDLDDKNMHTDEILSESINSEVIKNTNHEIYSNYKSHDKNNRVFFHCFLKLNYYAKPTYSDFFYTIQNLRVQLEKENISSISIANPVDDYNQFNYEKCKDIILFIFRNAQIKIILYQNIILNPSANQIPLILKENHDTPFSGHCGYHRMLNRIKQKYKWKQMRKDIKLYLKKCHSCQANKTLRKTYKSPMEITSTSSQPFERLAIDVVGPLPITEDGNKFVLTFQDDLTKFSHAMPISNHEAKTVANCLVSFISMFGIPKKILTDQGTDFMSNIIKDLNRLFHIKHSIATAYHPQTNGALERSHSTLKDYLKHYINQFQSDWDTYIPTAMFSYNTHVHSSTKFTPYELLFGHKPIIPSSINSNPEFKHTYESFYDQLKYRLNKSHEIAKTNLIASKHKSKELYDNKILNPTYNVNDMVYLQNSQSKVGQSKKLSPAYNGPYKIIEVQDPNVVIQIKNKQTKVHVNRLKPVSFTGTGSSGCFT